jgi:hypothetical protein
MSGAARWSRRDVLRAGLGAGGAALLPAGLAGCGFPHRRALWHNDIYTRCIDPERVSAPESLGDIVTAVQGAVRRRQRIRAVGAGHSFSDIAVVDGHLLRFDHIDQALSLDPRSLKAPWLDVPLVRVEAGMTVRQINAALDCRGLALRNMGGWDAQTAAGVISTATHGSGLEYGSSSAFVRCLVLVTQDGKVLQIERTDGITDPSRWRGVVTPDGFYTDARLVQDDDVFQAAAVGVGCLGVIYSVVLEVEKKYWLHEERSVSTWEQVRRDDGYVGAIVRDRAAPREESGPCKGERPRHYEIYVNPYARPDGQHTCLITRRFHRDYEPARPCTQRQQGWLTTFIAMDGDNPHLAVDNINLFPGGVRGHLDAGFGGMVGCYDNVSYRVFNAGDVNRMAAYAVEPALDLGRTVPAMNRLLDVAAALRSAGQGVNPGPIAIRFVQAADAYLAPQYGRATAMFEIQGLVGVKKMDDTLRAEETMLLQEFDARPHWGMDLRVIEELDTMRRLYPQFPAWERQFRLLNSAGVFNSEFTDRIGLTALDAAPARRKKSDDCSG